MRISDWSSDVCSSDLPSPCLPLHLTHRHAPFSQCGWFHLLACHDVMSKSLSYPSRHGFQRQSLGLMPRWTEPLRRRIATLACRGGVPVLCMSRSVECRVGKECVSTSRSRWSPYPEKQTILYGHREMRITSMPDR